MSNHRVGLFFSNLFSIIISFLIAYLSRFGWDPSDVAFRHLKDSTVFLYLLLSFLIVFTFYRYNPITAKRGILRHFKAAFLTNTFMAIIFSTIVYTTHISDSIPRLFFGTFFSINFTISFSCLFLIHLIKRQYLEHHTKKTLIITDSNSLEKAVYNIQKLNSEDCEIIGVSSLSNKQEGRFYKVKIHPLEKISNTKRAMENHQQGIDPLAHIELKELSLSILDYAKRHQVDLVIFNVNHIARKKIEHLIEAFSEMGIDSLITIDSFAIETLETKLEDFGTTNVIHLSPRLFTDGELLLKRLMDIAGALVGCLICILFGIIVAPLIFLEDPGPIIFKQKRVGHNGKYFYIYKFRSMYQDAEAKLQTLKDQNEMQGFMFKMKNDPRITKVGKFLRKTSIDELPQFFNVLEGSMSLIGTRPPTVNEYQQYSAHHKRRISIKPGITGLWQVSGRSEITDFEEIVRLDCFYIDHWSITSDLKILLKTFAAVFTGKGSE